MHSHPEITNQISQLLRISWIFLDVMVIRFSFSLIRNMRNKNEFIIIFTIAVFVELIADETFSSIPE